MLEMGSLAESHLVHLEVLKVTLEWVFSVVMLLMDEILHHMGCIKPCK